MKHPTPRQLEAYYWTHIVGLSQHEAGDRMGVTNTAISNLLNRFFEIRPKLKPDIHVCKKIKTAVSLTEAVDDDIVRRI
ncbi:MAG: helix-turn-helix transcriptional regulator [FCB group bacterium]|nr:helix-turn-helix transcriptional regulator [FCB group bacterium]